jgi:hypothetical protein
VTPVQAEQIEALARDLYRDHPAARALLAEAICAGDEERRIRASAALTALDPLNQVPEILRRAKARSERGALRLVEPERRLRPNADPDAWESGAGKAEDLAARTEPRGPRFEWAVDFLARTEAEPERPPKIRELWPGEGVFMRNSRPRGMKSLGLIEESLAATSNSGPAYHCERFEVPRPLKVAYLTEEDSERVVRARLHWLMAGRNVTDAGHLALLCRPGWNLETDLGAESLLVELRRLEPEVLVIDPARASMPGIDGGPKDGAVGAMLIRRILRETSVHLIGFGHHDTKPGREGVDVRARAEKASGGVLFSIADAPIGLTRQSDRETLAWPSHFKQGPDPAPFVIRFESATPTGPFRDFVRAVAVPYGEVEDSTALKEREVLLRLLDEQGAVVTRVAEAALPGARNGTAARHLAALEAAGKVRSVTGKGPLAALAERLGRQRWPANAMVWMRSEA